MIKHKFTSEEDDMLTTIDNPFNPKEEFDKWLSKDSELGYNTSEYIDRIAEFNDNDDDDVTRFKYEEAIFWILDNNPNIYKLI